MWANLIVTAGAIIFAWLVLKTLFDYLEPAKVMSDFKPCAGKWHEEFLVGCETLSRIPQQPVNTYTNLAYLAAGLYTYFALETGPAFVFALTMMYLCVGSALYHATSTGWAGMLDVTGIYTVYTATAVYGLVVLLGSAPDELTAAFMFAAAGLAAFLLSRYHRHMRAVIAISLGATYAFLLLRMILTGDWSPLVYLIGSVAAFAVAYWSWGLDRSRSFPLRRWGHGIWHLLTAAASGLVFFAIHLAALASG